jgi:hypothetical protein
VHFTGLKCGMYGDVRYEKQKQIFLNFNFNLVYYSGTHTREFLRLRRIQNINCRYVDVEQSYHETIITDATVSQNCGKNKREAM